MLPAKKRYYINRVVEYNMHMIFNTEYFPHSDTLYLILIFIIIKLSGAIPKTKELPTRNGKHLQRFLYCNSSRNGPAMLWQIYKGLKIKIRR